MGRIYEPDDGQLLEDLRFWSQALGLDRWEIIARIARYWEMDIDNAAQIEYQQPNSTAKILLLADADWPSKPFDHDMERELIHELLHAFFSDLDAALGEGPAAVLHRLLNELAKALVFARRQGASSGRKNHGDNGTPKETD